MNCDLVKENAALYIYGELADDARHEVENHLRRCPACAGELEAVRSLHAMLATVPLEEPSPNLLAASRMRLQESLETAQQSRGLSRFALDLAGWLNQVRFQPALAAVLLMMGFGAGIFATYSTLPKINGVRNGNVTTTADVDSASVASIHNITQDPTNNRVVINYDKVVPQQAQGSVDDPKIQQLLMYAARNNNSGVRLDSLSVLTQHTEDENVREALIYALRYDKNPGARLKAVNALAGYVKQDRQVRDAVLEALLRDDNSGVRIKAIEALAPVTSDAPVQQSLRVLAERDQNKFIKAESRRLLATAPAFE